MLKYHFYETNASVLENKLAELIQENIKKIEKPCANDPSHTQIHSFSLKTLPLLYNFAFIWDLQNITSSNSFLFSITIPFKLNIFTVFNTSGIQIYGLESLILKNTDGYYYAQRSYETWKIDCKTIKWEQLLEDYIIKKKCFIQTAVYQKNNNISHNNGNLNQNYSTLEKLAYECEIYEKTIQPETFKKRVNELFSNNEMKSSIIENNYKEDGEYDIIGS
jgi:hypothetical protein